MFQSYCRQSKHRKTPSSIEAYTHSKRLSLLSYEPHNPKRDGLSDLFLSQDKLVFNSDHELVCFGEAKNED